MAELMAECANSVMLLGVVLNLAGAGVLVETLAVKHNRCIAQSAFSGTEVVIVIEQIAVRPDVVVACSVRLLIAGIEDIDEVDIAIAIVVEQGEIDLIVDQLAGFCHHFFRVHVVAG